MMQVAVGITSRRRVAALVGAAALLAASSALALPPVQLADVSDGNGGFVIYGIGVEDWSGDCVSGAGDVNGDGLADVIIGARRADPGGMDSAGESYVVFGRAGGTQVFLTDVAAGQGGFVIYGIEAGDEAGQSVSAAGDVNGDGFDDVVIGAWLAERNNNNEIGESYVVFGKADGAAVYLSDVAAGIGGFVMTGNGGWDRTGVSASSAGDMNGDGLADVIVGAYYANTFPDGNDDGETYVIFGKADGAAVSLADVAAGVGGWGFVINGIDLDDYSGESVSGAGDVNGDGRVDLIVGTRNGDPGGAQDAGESYVVFGKADAVAVNLSDVAAGIGGFVINGIAAGDTAGRSVSGAGDVNGDGLADVVIGARNAAPGGRASAGEAYVVFGKADGKPVNLSDVAAGVGGFVMTGIDAGDQAGWCVSDAGDINRDGLADVSISAVGGDTPWDNAGESYVVFGKADGAPVNLADVVAGAGGFVIIGAFYADWSGTSISNAGDVNGDGVDDIVVGARRADADGTYDAGETYVVFSPVILGDLDGDGLVGITDLLLLLGAWGPCPDSCKRFCPGDVDGDCTVGITDLLLVLIGWG